MTGLARQMAQLRADIQVQDENARQLLALLESLRQENSQLKRDVGTLRKEVAQLRSQRQAQATRLQELARALEEERAARKQMAASVVKTVSREVAKLMERTAPAERPSAGGAVQGEYTVARGDTLSAIAKAFGVSVKRLKQANRLEKDVIRVGQKLIIPAR
jgi:LysM repeat protein